MNNMKQLMIFTFFLLSNWIVAQEKQIIEASSDDDLTKMVSTQLQYLFPEFTRALIQYADPPRVVGQLNYNMLACEMQFMYHDEVLALESKGVVMIEIDNRKFYPFKKDEFVEELASANHYQLRVRHRCKMTPHSKKSAYGISSSAHRCSLPKLQWEL
jgi:hypothetical protein